MELLLQSYTEYHSDIFPDTAAGIPAMTAQEWLNGENKPVSKILISCRCY